MKLLLVLVTAAGLALLGLVSSASAFLPGQPQIHSAAHAISDTVEVKNKFKFKKWKKWKKRPPGWDRGRKVGWRGGKVPPGQRYR